MKLGYSLFLRKYIMPIEVEYGDCKTFQIVCPECKEPVFKVTRQSNDMNVDYFSHYKKDETLNTQCELRVNAISNQSIESINIKSKEQSLKSFLKIFQNIVWDNEYDSDTLKQSKKIFSRIHSCSTYSAFIIKVIHSMRSIAYDRSDIYERFDESIENIYKEINEFTTQFSINLQKDFAYDLNQHLLAGNSKTNYIFLMNHAFVLFYNKLKKKQNDEILEWEIEILNYLTKYLNTNNPDKRMKIFSKMASKLIISPYTHEQIDLFSMFGSQLHYHALAILLRIPYLNIIEGTK